MQQIKRMSQLKCMRNVVNIHFFWLYFILIVSSAINQTNDDTVYWSIFISPVGLLLTWINFNPTMDK